MKIDEEKEKVAKNFKNCWDISIEIFLIRLGKFSVITLQYFMNFLFIFNTIWNEITIIRTSSALRVEGGKGGDRDVENLKVMGGGRLSFGKIFS